MIADCNSSTNRNWRYHKELMMWLTKDQNLPDPTPISTEAERGSYIFFNHQTWQRARVRLAPETRDNPIVDFRFSQNSS